MTFKLTKMSYLSNNKTKAKKFVNIMYELD